MPPQQNNVRQVQRQNGRRSVNNAVARQTASNALPVDQQQILENARRLNADDDEDYQELYTLISDAIANGRFVLVKKLLLLDPGIHNIHTLLESNIIWTSQTLYPLLDVIYDKPEEMFELLAKENFDTFEKKKLFMDYLLSKTNDSKLHTKILAFLQQNSSLNAQDTPKNTFNELNTVMNWTLNADENDEFPTKCETLVSGVDPAFYDFTRKVARVCTDALVSPENTKKMDKSVALYLSQVTKQKTILIVKTDLQDHFGSLVDAVGKRALDTLPISLKDIDIEYQNAGMEGVGPGVVRDFFSACIEQVQKELFEPCFEGSDVYRLKRSLDLNDKITKRKLVCLGYLLAVMVMNGLEFTTIKVQRALLHMCMYNTPPSRDISYLVYQMIEDPDSTRFISTLLRNPDDIEHSGLDFEDLGRSQKPVTKRNFLSFLRIWVQHHYIPPACRYVVQGFNIKSGIADYLLKLNLTIYKFYGKLAAKDVTKSYKENFVKSIVFGDNVPKSIQEWLPSVILNSKPDFFRGLLHFWSSLYTPMPNVKYQVVIGTRVYSEKLCPLPEAHTCYYQLVIPQNIPSEKLLEQSLKKAVSQSQSGIGMVGGKKKTKKR